MSEIISNEPFVFNTGAEELKPLEAIKVNTEPSVKEQIEVQNNVDSVKEGEETSEIKESFEDAIFGDREYRDDYKEDPPNSNEDSEVEENEEEIQEEEREEKESDLNEEEEELNIYEFMAKQLKVDGELPEDFEIGENVTASDIYEAYVDYIKEDAQEEIRNAVFQELRDNGVNQADLQYARLLRQGVDPRILNEASTYEMYSNLDIDKAEESLKKEVVEKMYKDKNLSERAIKKLIDAAEIDDDLDPMAEEAKKYFKAKHDSIIEEQENLAEKKKAQRDAIVKRDEGIIKNILKNSSVLGEEIEDIKDFKRSLYQRDQTVDINGQKMVATEYQLFDLAYQENPEVKLWAFKKWKYRDTDEQDIKDQAEAKAEKELIEAYKNSVEKSQKKLKSSKLKKELKENPIKNKPRKSRFSGPQVVKF